MAADLHIHVYSEGELTETDFASFFSSTMGSKWFNYAQYDNIIEMNEEDYQAKIVEQNTITDKIVSTKSVWIGEVSWLKAALTEDTETFVPSLVEQVNDLIAEDLPIIDDNLIILISNTFETCTNDTDYALNSCIEVISFLNQHRGKRAFTVSW